MSEGRIALAPALCSAGGIVIGTLVAVATMHRSLPLQMLGPLLLAGSMLASDVLAARARGVRRGPSGTALFLALACFAALLLTGLGNADMVPMMLPIIGGGIASPLLTPAKRRKPSRMDLP
jgi:hypothetical protein